MHRRGGDGDSGLTDAMAGPGVGRSEALASEGGREGAVVAVLGGAGGAGATSLATTLARVAQDEGRDAALIDLDTWGAGVDLPLDACLEPGLRWNDLAHAQGRLSGARLVASLPTVAGLPVLTFERSAAAVSAAAVTAVVEALARQRLLVVVDLPRRLEPAVRAAIDLADRLLLVVPASVPGVLSAARTVEAATPDGGGDGPRWEGVVRHVGHAWDADVVASTLGLPLLCELPHDNGLAALGRGEMRLSRRSRYRSSLLGLLTELLPLPVPVAARERVS